MRADAVSMRVWTGVGPVLRSSIAVLKASLRTEIAEDKDANEEVEDKELREEPVLSIEEVCLCDIFTGVAKSPNPLTSQVTSQKRKC